MIKHLIIVISCVLCINSAFSQKGGSFEINGVMENAYEGPVSLQYYDEKGNVFKKQSTIKNNRFYFTGELPERAKASLLIPGLSSNHFFFMDTGKISIKLKLDTVYQDGHARKGFAISNITGSPSQQIWDETVEHFGKITRCEAPDSVKSEDNYALLLSVVKKHPELYVTRELILYAETMSYTQLKNVFDLVPKQKQETTLGTAIKKRLNGLAGTQTNMYIFFPAQKDKDGKEITLDKLDFKYLLIDFWASWCAPCRKEHPAMIGLYNKYRSNGFEMLGISLDTEKQKWLKAINDDRLPWQQVSDLKGNNTEIVTHYAINSIPFNILIDRSGKIIATNITGEKLERKIKALFEN